MFLISDFLHGSGDGKRDIFQEIGRTNSRHDLVCIQLQDDRERALPESGMLVVEDMETGEVIEVDSTRQTVRDAFAASVTRQQETLDRALMQSGVDMLRLGATDDHAAALQHFFEHRRRR